VTCGNNGLGAPCDLTSNFCCNRTGADFTCGPSVCGVSPNVSSENQINCGGALNCPMNMVCCALFSEGTSLTACRADGRGAGGTPCDFGQFQACYGAAECPAGTLCNNGFCSTQ
jgi:hypothetical protein